MQSVVTNAVNMLKRKRRLYSLVRDQDSRIISRQFRHKC